MQLRTSGFRCLRDLRLDIGPGTTLVAGPNGAGKSTLALALRCVLTGTPNPFGGRRSDGTRLLGRDVRKAALLLQEGEASLRLEWPGGGPRVRGEPPQASAIAVGSLRFAALPADERALRFAAAAKAVPDGGELRRAFEDAGLTGHAEAWALVEREGWDAAARAHADEARDRKARWCEVAGRARHGDKAALEWRPDGFGDAAMDELDERALEAMVAEAGAARDAAVARGAVAAASLGETSRDAEALAAREAALASARVALVDALEMRSEAAAALDKADKSAPLVACPHCGAECEVVARPGDGPALRIPAPGRVRLATHDHRLLQDLLRDAQTRVNAESRNVEECEAALHASVRARDTLARLSADEMRPGDALMRADAALLAARSTLDGLRRWRRAEELRLEVEAASARAALLGPAGVRKAKLGETIDAANILLEGMSEAWEGGPVRLDHDLDVTYAGFPYEDLSGGERFRVDVTLQLLLAGMEGAPIVVVDGADVLDVRGRNALLALLRDAPCPALVTMTMSGPDRTPDLAAKGLGRTYWLDGGVLAPIAGPAERAA